MLQRKRRAFFEEVPGSGAGATHYQAEGDFQNVVRQQMAKEAPVVSEGTSMKQLLHQLRDHRSAKVGAAPPAAGAPGQRWQRICKAAHFLCQHFCILASLGKKCEVGSLCKALAYAGSWAPLKVIDLFGGFRQMPLEAILSLSSSASWFTPALSP